MNKLPLDWNEITAGEQLLVLPKDAPIIIVGYILPTDPSLVAAHMGNAINGSDPSMIDVTLINAYATGYDTDPAIWDLAVQLATTESREPDHSVNDDWAYLPEKRFTMPLEWPQKMFRVFTNAPVEITSEDRPNWFTTQPQENDALLHDVEDAPRTAARRKALAVYTAQHNKTAVYVLKRKDRGGYRAWATDTRDYVENANHAQTYTTVAQATCSQRPEIEDVVDLHTGQLMNSYGRTAAKQEKSVLQSKTAARRAALSRYVKQGAALPYHTQVTCPRCSNPAKPIGGTRCRCEKGHVFDIADTQERELTHAV